MANGRQTKQGQSKSMESKNNQGREKSSSFATKHDMKSIQFTLF